MIHSMGLVFGGAGSAAVAGRELGLSIEYNYEPRGKCYNRTFITNFPGTISSESHIEFKYKSDIIVGQPDCKIYSRLRTRKKSNEDIKFSDTQLYEFFRIMQRLMPKVWIVENLNQGIEDAYDFITSRYKVDYLFSRVFLQEEIAHTSFLNDLYYLTKFNLDAKYFLPQSRKRSFIVALLKMNYKSPFRFNPPTSQYEGGVKVALNLVKKYSEEVTNNNPPLHSKERIQSFKRLKFGESFYGTQNNRRLDPEKNAGAITSHCTQYVHPYEDRTLTCRENATIMGWPLGFDFIGNNTQCLDMAGKAVAVPVIKYILQQILKCEEK